MFSFLNLLSPNAFVQRHSPDSKVTRLSSSGTSCFWNKTLSGEKNPETKQLKSLQDFSVVRTAKRIYVGFERNNDHIKTTLPGSEFQIILSTWKISIYFLCKRVTNKRGLWTNIFMQVTEPITVKVLVSLVLKIYSSLIASKTFLKTLPLHSVMDLKEQCHSSTQTCTGS